MHLHRLRHRHPRIVLADQEDRWGRHSRHVAQRRALPVDVDGGVLLPWRAAEPGRSINAHIALPVHRDPVGGARTRAGRFEAIGERDDLVGHVAASAPAHLPHAIAIHESLFDQVVDARHHIEVRIREVVADHVAQELIAVAGAAAVVGLQDHVTHRGQDLNVVPKRPESEPVRRRRTAVCLHDERVTLPLLVIQRVVEQPLDGDAIGPRPLHGFLARQSIRCFQVVKEMRHLPRPRAAPLLEHPYVAGIGPLRDLKDMPPQLWVVRPAADAVIAFGQALVTVRRHLDAEQILAHARVGQEVDVTPVGRPGRVHHLVGEIRHQQTGGPPGRRSHE